MQKVSFFSLLIVILIIQKTASDTLFSVSLQAMEIFWELALTIAISLLLPWILVKLVSMAPNHDPDVKVAISECDIGVKSDIQDWKSEAAVRFAGRVDEFRGESILEKLIVPEILEVSCGSPKIRNAEKIGERRIYSEIEIVDLTEKRVQMTCQDYRIIRECQQNLEIDERSGVTEISDVPEIVSCGSPKKRYAEKIGEGRIYSEIEIVDLTERHVEKTSQDYGIICECQQNLEIDESSEVTEIIDVPEILEVSCASPKIRNAEKIGERITYSEIEIVDLTKKCVETTSQDYSIICECRRNLEIDESSEVTEISDAEIELFGFESREHEVEEVKISQSDSDIDEFCQKNKVEVENRGLLDEDDWEGIERTELERLFGAAVVFVGSKSNANRIGSLSNDLKMQLYGFHKIATQGPCREPQPMALKFSARAKWNAWQQLGTMSPELAMERYITILSESIPDWMSDYPDEKGKPVYADIQAFEMLPLDLKA